jgi:DNA-binding transcriptional LysR family regulator
MVCRQAGVTPRITSFSDEIVVVQSFVAAGIGVTTIPGLALQAHRRSDIHATEVPEYRRLLYAVTYGEPPDPPASVALIEALQDSFPM